MPKRTDEGLVCPHCKDRMTGLSLETNYENVRHYGSKTFREFCPLCAEPIRIFIKREVWVRSVSIGNHTEAD